MVALSLIIAGIVMRFMPHAPNVTPVAAIALFSGMYVSKKYALWVPLALMIVSDAFLGFHNVIAFTWGSFILVSWLGRKAHMHRNIRATIGLGIASSLSFYLVTNFGVWIMGWYPKTIQGLAQCYINAIPFLRNFTLATVAYGIILHVAYETIARRVSSR